MVATPDREMTSIFGEPHLGSVQGLGLGSARARERSTVQVKARVSAIPLGTRKQTQENATCSGRGHEEVKCRWKAKMV